MAVNARNGIAFSGISAFNGIAKSALSAIDGQATPGGGGSTAWVQLTAPTQGGGSSSPTINFPVTTTAGNMIGVVFSTFSNVPSAVVGNISGGGTVAMTQRGSYSITLSGETAYVYTVDAASACTSITITLASFGNPECMMMEASSATYDVSNNSNTLGSAAEHTVSATTTAGNDVIAVYGFTNGTVSTVHAGYTQVGATTAGGFFTLQSTSATGGAGSKTSGFTPTASASSGLIMVALK